MYSVLQGSFADLLLTGHYAVHHVFEGVRNRKKSERYGFLVALRPAEHERIHREADTVWKEAAERYWIEHIGTEDEFRDVFGRSYL